MRMPVRTRSRSFARTWTRLAPRWPAPDGRAARSRRASLLRRPVGPRGGRCDGKAGRNRSGSPVQGDRGTPPRLRITEQVATGARSGWPGTPGRRTMDDEMQASVGAELEVGRRLGDYARARLTPSDGGEGPFAGESDARSAAGVRRSGGRRRRRGAGRRRAGARRRPRRGGGLLLAAALRSGWWVARSRAPGRAGRCTGRRSGSKA